MRVTARAWHRKRPRARLAAWAPLGGDGWRESSRPDLLAVCPEELAALVEHGFSMTWSAVPEQLLARLRALASATSWGSDPSRRLPTRDDRAGRGRRCRAREPRHRMSSPADVSNLAQSDAFRASPLSVVPEAQPCSHAPADRTRAYE